MRDPNQPTEELSRSMAVYDMLDGYYTNHDREEFLVLCLDQKNKVNSINSVSTGSLTATIVHPREVFKSAVLSSASSVILVHNHPSGDHTPSWEDKSMTRRLVEAGKLLGIEVLDHLVIGKDGYYLFKDARLI